MKVQAEDLSYVLCPGSMPNTHFTKTYNAIYKCWDYVWSEAFKELNVKKAFYSDAFSRQDYVGAIFHKDICLGMAFFRWADASRPEFNKDSYFAIWGADDLECLRSRGNNIIVCSNFTVHPAARGSNLGISGKDLLLGMIVETFINSNADAMTGAVRVDRGVSKACDRWGSLLIKEQVPCEYGEKNTDLLGFFKDHIAQQPANILKPLVENIWARRLVIPRMSVGSEFTSPIKVHAKNDSASA